MEKNNFYKNHKYKFKVQIKDNLLLHRVSIIRAARTGLGISTYRSSLAMPKFWRWSTARRKATTSNIQNSEGISKVQGILIFSWEPVIRLVKKSTVILSMANEFCCHKHRKLLNILLYFSDEPVPII